MKSDIEAKLEDLLSRAESEVIEFKEAKSNYDFKKMGRYFSALANEANLKNSRHAWLVFGVRDDRTVVGTGYRTNTSDLHHLKSEIAQHTTSRITFQEIYEVQTELGRVILFQIAAAPQGMPIAWQGHYYGRDGEELNALNIGEIEQIRKQRPTEDWSAKICEGASLEDLSPEAILKARSAYKTRFSHLIPEIDAWDDITFLNKAKVCIKGQVTRTAILLLGKSEAEHFISPAVAKVSWILKDRDNLEKDYEHFSCPFILTVDKVYQKVRNLRYRYIRENTLFPDEVQQYDPYLIRESLHNCIAHQDYSLAGKINVIESEDDFLIFMNVGSFIPQTIENVMINDAPELNYRNTFLANAMVNLNMIDTIGSGIKRMFIIQKNKYFPLPEYDFSDNKVKVTFFGKVLDINYARKLAQAPNLRLSEIMLLDKIQKEKELADFEIKTLRKKSLIEGRKPNFHISATIAAQTGQEEDYMDMKGIDDEYCRKIIIEYLTKFGKAKRSDLAKVLAKKLSNKLNKDQKLNKITNNLRKLRENDIIETDGREWILKKSE
jgi:ATP-dependent DNA helicase RecG